MIPLLLTIGMGAMFVGSIGLTIYGIVLSFEKKWYIGAVALVIPLFAQVVAIAKICGKDILKNEQPKQ